MSEASPDKVGISLLAVAGLLLLAGIITGRLGLMIAIAPLALIFAARFRKQ